MHRRAAFALLVESECGQPQLSRPLKIAACAPLSWHRDDVRGGGDATNGGAGEFEEVRRLLPGRQGA